MVSCADLWASRPTAWSARLRPMPGLLSLASRTTTACMPDAYLNRREQMFPRLTAAQLERIAPFGEQRATHAGEVLFEQGDPTPSFYVILEGSVEVSRPTGEVREMVTVHHAGEFSGEMSLLSSQRSLVRGQVLEGGTVLVLPREQLRALVQRDSELSEILMRAFILRRVALIATGGDLVLIGSRHSANTLRLKEFLTRNGQPFTYQDVEREAGVQTMLERFQVGIDEVPVVLCSRADT